MTMPQRLRRYLRALLGNAALADEAMLDALERMVAERQVMTALAAFHAAQRVAMRLSPTRPATDEPLRQALAALPSRTRAAFLLVRLEHFGAEEAAEIMDMDPDQVLDEARQAALQIQDMLVPTGGTALITDPDQLTALDLANIAADVGFNAIREPVPTPLTLQGQPRPLLIICEAGPRGGNTADSIGALASRFDAAVLCVTAARDAQEFTARIPGARLLRKPFESATAARTILDVVAEHRYSRISVRLEGED